MKLTQRKAWQGCATLALLLTLATPACLAQKDLDGEGRDHAKLRETMEIMKRILSEDLRAVCSPTGATAEDAVRAFSSGSGCERALYVPGMGVVFLFDLRVEMVPVREETVPEDERPPSTDRWEKAATSIQQNTLSLFLGASVSGQKKVRYEYSRETLDRLGDAALLALVEHGSNFQEIDEEESLVVVMEIKGGASASVYANSLLSYQQALVQSPEGAAVPPAGGARSRGGPSAYGVLATASAPDCHLVVRIRRCDADDFVRGRLLPADLRRRAKVDLF